MSIPEDISHLISNLFSNYTVQQIAPLIVVVVLPLLVLTAQPHIASLFRHTYMVLESLVLALPWNWKSASSSSGSVSDRNKLKKKTVVRTRADQLALNGDAAVGPSNVPTYFEGYYPGLVNLSGSYCFLNATLQAMASLSYLQPHIDYIFNKAESLTVIVHTPVIDELRDLLHNLNTPSSSQLSIRPEEIITALSRYSNGKHNPLFSSRQHQDAQELFQLVSECIKREIAAVDRESYRDRGLAGSANGAASGSGSGTRSRRQIGKSVFDGLTANRRSCKECGYTEAVMHFAFDNWQLALPRMSYCTLEALLEDYTRLEELDDCICRRCSMEATHDRLVYEAAKLTKAASTSDASPSKKRRAREARALEVKVKAALDDGRIEDDIKGLQMEKVFSRASTKQAMIARPPPVLALHLNRSIHYGGGDAARNNCRVAFSEFLDLTPYTTSGQLSTEPNHPISSPPPPPHRSATPTLATYTYPRYIYRLSAVVCHYGSHYAGHYVSYRRKPRPPSAGSKRWAPPRFTCPPACKCEGCLRWGSIRDEWDMQQGDSGANRRGGGGWLMASDTHVREVGITEVLQEGAGAFMLFYERVIPYTGHNTHHPHQGSHGKASMRSDTTGAGMAGGLPIQGNGSGVYSSTSPKSSEETLRPGMDGSRSSASLIGMDEKNATAGTAGPDHLDVKVKAEVEGGDIKKEGEKVKVVKVVDEEVSIRKPIPRVLMNVATQRGRNVSVPPAGPTPKPDPDPKAPNDPQPQTQATPTELNTTHKTAQVAHLPNGDASHTHPAPVSLVPIANSSSSPKTPKKKKPPIAESQVGRSPSPERSPSSPSSSPSTSLSVSSVSSVSPSTSVTSATSTATGTSAPPSPSTSRQNRHHQKQHAQRVKSPSSPRPVSPSPVRTVGLRA